MKKTLLLLIVLFAFGCKTEVEPQDSLKVFDKNFLSETSQMFVPLANVAWDFVVNPNSRKIVYDEIERQFDGDNNVLFKTLITDESSSLGRVANSETIQKAKAALEVFKSVDEAGPVYPQIFIPFYEELKEAGKIGIQNPVIIFRDGPPTKDEKYQGYSFRKGELMDKGMISEDFASKNEVWVISINERVDLNGEIPAEDKIGDTNSKLHSFDSPAIEGLAIHGKSCMKEDWIGGAAEVAWTARVFFNSYNTDSWAEYTYSDRGSNTNPRDNIREVSRKSAKNNTYQYLAPENKWFVYDWTNDPRYNTYYEALHTIFEYDPWPAGVQISTIENYTEFSLLYRSYETPFLAERVFRGDMGYHWVDTGCFGIIID